MLIEMHDHVALVRLKGGKANAMTAEFLHGLARLFDELERGPARAVVVTGDGPHFSAGLALPALMGLDRPAMREFIDLFAGAMLKVFRCERPVVAAINGHAIAGGCVLALMCDLRLLADGNAKLGLTEVQLGIGLPAVVVEPLRLQVPPASLLPIALEGRLVGVREARELGLAHEIVAAAQLEERALARASELARLPPAGFAQVKASVRRPAIAAIAAHAESERERWLDSWFSDEAQRRLADQVARLTRPS